MRHRSSSDSVGYPKRLIQHDLRCLWDYRKLGFEPSYVSPARPCPLDRAVQVSLASRPPAALPRQSYPSAIGQSVVQAWPPTCRTATSAMPALRPWQRSCRRTPWQRARRVRRRARPGRLLATDRDRRPRPAARGGSSTAVRLLDELRLCVERPGRRARAAGVLLDRRREANRMPCPP